MCGEGLEFDDDDDMCTCIVVSASMYYCTQLLSMHRTHAISYTVGVGYVTSCARSFNRTHISLYTYWK